MIGIVVENEHGEKEIKVLSGAGFGVPLGTIVANFSEVAPDGFLECDGSSFDTEKYSMLYSLLKKDHLPDLRGKALIGYDNDNSIGKTLLGCNEEIVYKYVCIMWCIKATAAYVEPDTASELQNTIQANDKSYIDQQLANVFEYVEEHIPTASVPIGTIISLENHETAPSGYLKADGSTFDETAYPALYRYLGNSNVLPRKIEFDSEGDRELYVEKIIGEINGKLVYQLTIEDNVNRAGSTWYDMTGLFAGYLDPADVDYFLDGAAVGNLHHSGDGYQHDAFYGTIVGTNRAKTVINIWFQHQNHSEKLNYPSENQEPKYITVRYTRVANPIATPKYKYIRAISGIDESENTVLTDYLNSLESRLTQSGAEPIGTLRSIYNGNSGVTPVGYLKCDGSTFDTNQYPVLYAYLNSDTLPVIRDYTDTEVTEPNVEKIVGEWNGKPVYEVTVAHGSNVSSNTWYDATADFASIITPSELERFVGNAYLFNGYYDANQWWESDPQIIMAKNSTETQFRIYSISMSTYPMTNAKSGQGPLYLRVRYTRKDDSTAKAEVKYKFMKAVSGVDETESAEVVSHINDLMDRVAYSTLPVGNLIDVQNDSFIPAGYLKCDGSTFDETQYPLLYHYLGDSNVLPNLYDKEVNIQPDYRGVYRSDNYTGDIPRFASVKAVLEDAGIDVNGTGFRDDALLVISIKRYWEMLWIQNPDGTVWCQGQVPFCDLDNDTVTIPVKKGQKIYAITETGGSTNAQPPAGTYDSPECYVSIYYYKNHKYIKAVSGVEDNSAEASDIVNQVTDMYNGLFNKVASSGMPLGTVLTLPNENVNPAGYLKCDGSAFDTTKYSLLYDYLGSDHLPNLYDKNSLPAEPQFRGTTRTTYKGDFSLYTTVEEVVRAAGVAYDQGGFQEDGSITIVNYSWCMLWLEDPDGNVWCPGQVTYADSYDSVWATIPVKKGQKIWALSRTGADKNTKPSAGDYYTDANFYLSIYYYTKHQYIKAVTGLEDNDEEATAIASQVEALTEKVAYSSLPVGNVITLANNSITPAGYLKADGSTFDETKYPLLYHYLGDKNKLPNLYDKSVMSEAPDIAIQTNSLNASYPYSWRHDSLVYTTATPTERKEWCIKFEYDGMVSLWVDDWFTIYIGDEDGNLVATYAGGIRDNAGNCITFPVKAGQQILTVNREATVNLNVFYIGDYAQLYVWYYKNYKYIKAVSGVEDNSDEATEIASNIEALTKKIAYCGQPVGHTMFMANNNVTPTGYLKCDGRDTTGTPDELETHYPLLYAYLGNTNVLPCITDGVVHKQAPDIALMSNSHNATYPYSWHKDLLVYSTATPAERKNWCIKFEHDGFVDMGSDDWFTVYIGDEEGNLVATYNAGVHDNASGFISFPVKKGQQILTINRESSINLNKFYFGDYSHLFVWYYDNFAYIKAVSGIEDGSTEATEVVNAITQATDSIERHAEKYVNKLHMPASFDNWWNYKFDVDYPIGEFDGKIVYRRIWRDPNNYTASDSWRLIATDPHIGMIFNIKTIVNNYTNYYNNGSDNNDTYMYGGRNIRYRFTRSNGDLYTATSNDTQCDMYYIMDFTKATHSNAIRMGNATVNRFTPSTDYKVNEEGKFTSYAEYIKYKNFDFTYWVPLTTYTATAVINAETGLALGSGWVYIPIWDEESELMRLYVQNTSSFDYYAIDLNDYGRTVGEVHTASAKLNPTTYAYVIKGKFMES